MGTKKIKVDTELYERARQYAETAGYASVDEMITHILEKELAKTGDDHGSIEETEKRLRGLGYIA
jgi:hypothetical protein